ncbi:MAG: hypothetical protein ACD_73C00543G0002 [uncultured bacterium]|nr:MAG: hypothetical protein ACD_73C00543G0002 [uncultured bacterium]
MATFFLVVVFCFILWFLLEPLFRKDLAAQVEVSHDTMNFEIRKQLVMESLKDLELDHQSHKMDDVDYKEMKQEMVSEGVHVMKELDRLSDKK